MAEVRYLKPQPVAARYGISLSTTYEHMANGNFRAVKNGRSTLIDVQSVENYFNSLPAAKIGGARANRSAAA